MWVLRNTTSFNWYFSTAFSNSLLYVNPLLHSISSSFLSLFSSLHFISSCFFIPLHDQEVYSSTFRILFHVHLSENIPWSIFSIALSAVTWFSVLFFWTGCWTSYMRGFQLFFFLRADGGDRRGYKVCGHKLWFIHAASINSASSSLQQHGSLDQVWLSFLALVPE